MTREEAINELKYAKSMCEFDPITGELGCRNDEDKRQSEAFGIAIKALENKNALIDSEQDFHTGPHTVVLDRITINGKVYLAADKVLEIIDQMDKENEECNDEISRLILRIEHKDFRERVLALKGGEQDEDSRC